MATEHRDDDIISIVYTDALKAHMESRNLKHIEIMTTESRTCQREVKDIVIRLLTDRGAARASAGASHILEGEMGNVLISSPDLEYDTEIEFDIRSFLGVEDPIVSGVRLRLPVPAHAFPSQDSPYRQTDDIHSHLENP